MIPGMVSLIFTNASRWDEDGDLVIPLVILPGDNQDATLDRMGLSRERIFVEEGNILALDLGVPLDLTGVSPELRGDIAEAIGVAYVKGGDAGAQRALEEERAHRRRADELARQGEDEEASE